MTPLVAIIVVVLVGVLAANVAGRARAGVRSVRSHHRALDTLGNITTRHPASEVRVASMPPVPRQAHIRILSPIVEEEPAPEPVVEAEIEVELEAPVYAPAGSVFHLVPAPRNDIWDTDAIREMFDGPGESEIAGGTEASAVPGDAGGEVDDDTTLGGRDPMVWYGPGQGRPGDGRPGDDRAVIDLTDAALTEAALTEAALTEAALTEAALTEAALTEAAVAGAGPGRVTSGPRSNGDLGSGSAAFGHDPLSGDPLSGGPLPIAYAAGRNGGRVTVAIPAPGPRHLTGRRPPVRQVVAAAMVILLAVITAAVVLGHHHHTTATSPVAHRSPVTTVPHALRGARAATPKHGARVTLISNVAGTLHYRVAGTPRVTLRAAAPCWVDIRRTDASGPELYTTTMAAGATESVTAPAWVRLGRPGAVAVTVGGAPVSLPVVGGAPYNLLFG